MSFTGGGRHLLLGGLGWPHDALVAATLVARGHRAATLGELDAEAFERGRAALPRGQCAPILYTTGALLREVARLARRAPVDVLSVRTCGPCRYALFEPAWERALAGRGHTRFIGVDQSLAGLRTLLGEPGLERALDALLVADVLREVANRLRPRVRDPDELERRVAAAVREIAVAVAEGRPPIAAMGACSAWHEGMERRPTAPLARVALVGEPWSLHVDGAGQLDLPRVLARAGAEVEAPPFALWIAYVLWQMRAAPVGAGEPPGPSAVATARGFEARLRDRLARASEAAELGGFALPSMDALAALAAPHLSPDLRGGYGHLEVGLALRARVERRAHLVVSIKSFGCIPSSGVSDAIVPTALGADLPFLSLEVSGDGAAARESRLMLQLSAATEAADREVASARRDAGACDATLPDVVDDPLAGRYEVGVRPYACTLACHLARASTALGRSAPRAAG